MAPNDLTAGGRPTPGRNPEEPVLDPDIPIVDPHHHLWVRPGNHYLLPELVADIRAGHDIRATIYVECGSHYRAEGPEALRSLGEAEFVRTTAERCARERLSPARICAGMVAHVDLRCAATIEGTIERIRDASGDRLCGIRQSATWDRDNVFSTAPNRAPPGLLLDRAFREGFARLAALGLPFDASVYHPQLPELLDLARAFPAATMVIDHCGTPLGSGTYAGRSAEAFAVWKESMRALSQCPAVYVKLGGLGMPLCGFGFDRLQTPPGSEALAAAWRPHIETCMELFGAARCMFESNFPADRPSCAYPTLWNAFKRIAGGCSPAERSALFAETAERIYLRRSGGGVDAA